MVAQEFFLDEMGLAGIFLKRRLGAVVSLATYLTKSTI
jgi:hypothetical protein